MASENANGSELTRVQIAAEPFRNNLSEDWRWERRPRGIEASRDDRHDQPIRDEAHEAIPNKVIPNNASYMSGQGAPQNTVSETFSDGTIYGEPRANLSRSLLLDAGKTGYERTACSRGPSAVVLDGRKPRVIRVHIAVKPQINCAQPASGDG